MFSTCFLVLTFSTKGQEPNADAKLHYTRGSVAYESKDYSTAITEFQQAIENAPEFTSARMSLAYSYIETNQIEKAEEQFLAITKYLENPHLQFFELGLIAENSGDLEKAIEYSNQAIHSGKDAKYYYQRGIQHFKNESYAEAINDFSETLKLNPQFKDAYNDRGSAHRMQKDNESAIKDYKQAKDLGRGSVIAYNNLGNTYRETGEYEEAINVYNTALSISKDNPMVLNNRGLAKFNNGDLEGAIEDFKKVIQIQPDNASAYNNLGGVYIEKEDYEKAIEYSSKSLSKDEDYAYAYYNRAVAYEMLRKDIQACQDWQKAADLGIKAAESYSNKMNCEN